MILGDGLYVMASLATREGLRAGSRGRYAREKWGRR
jgi:hypothetical protein